VRPSDVYAVMFTSGSTGRSKGALLPHAHGHLLNERNSELLGMDRDSVYSTELPLFHINAHMTVYSSMLHGATARLEERFSATRWLERVRASGATHTSVLGVIVDFLLRQPVAEDDADNPMRSAWMVPCLPDMADRFRDRYGLERVVTSYGTSETGMVARRIVERGAENVAMDVDGSLHEIHVVDDDDEPLPTGEAGEIVVRPKLPWTTALGYFGMQDNTITAMRNLWFHTGDVGRFDEQGRLSFVDRVQDRLRRRGENVASGDVEYVIGQHESVAEVAVVAVAADEEGGEDEIKACVVPASGATFDAAELWEYCDRRLPYFAVPRYLEVFASLPKTPTEKIIKGELRRQGAGLELHDRGVVARPARTSAGAAS
jgi:carnitine-CoA ligase